MKILLLILILLNAVACSSEGRQDEFKSIDASKCETAIKYPIAQMTEKMIASNYSGEINNYWGEDKEILDVKHTFKNGELIQSKFYYKNGKVQELYNFKCQSLHGEFKVFYKNGILGKIIPYKYGRKEGQGILYDSLGVLIKKVSFKKDSLILNKVR